MVDQDLEAFLGVPITVWSEVEGRPSGIGCSLEGVEVMVYNGVSATDGFESAMETHYKGTEPIDGTNSGYLDGGDDPYFGYVAIDDVVVSFGFTSMTKEQLTVFGRLVERVGTDLLER